MSALRLLWRRALMTLSEQMHDRFTFFGELILQFVGLAINVFFFRVIFSHVPTLHGWRFEEVVILLGFWQIVDGLAGFILFLNVRKLPALVRYGQLDPLLTQPIDVQINLLQRFEWRTVGNFVGAALLIGYGSSLLHLSPLLVIATTLGVIVLGFLFQWSLNFGLNTLGFWLIRNDNLGHVAEGIADLAKLPTDAYGRNLGLFFTFVLPLAVVATIPAQFLAGRLDWTVAVIAIGITVLLFAASRWFFFWALRSYESASG